MVMEAKKKSYAVIHKISSENPRDTDIIELIGISDDHIKALGMVMDNMFLIHEHNVESYDYEIVKREDFVAIDDCDNGIMWTWKMKNRNGGNYNPIHTWMLLYKFEY